MPQLRDAGHEVVAMVRSPEKAGAVFAVGATPIISDALDRGAVLEAVARGEPEVVVDQLTSLARVRSARRLDRGFEMTNRLRTQGTDHLLAAASAVGASRFVAQSYAGWPYARQGGAVKTEEDPLDPDPPANVRRTLDALRSLEAAVAGA